MKIELLHYPVLRFSKGMVFPARTSDELEQCTTTALRNGFFSGLLLVDSDGQAVTVTGARKLHGVGPFFGFNIFLNQRIRVALEASGSAQLGVNEVRRMVLSAIHGKQGWDSMDDVSQLVARVERAQSIAEIATEVVAAYY